MATNIFNYDGSLLTTVADGSLDQTHATIKFPGKGYQNYGEPVMENLLWILQNFSGTNKPSLPVTGQLWYDTTAGASLLKVYNGIDWVTAGGVIASNDPPNAGSNLGAFWYDTKNKQLNSWNGNNWDIIGPLGSSINEDPRDPAIPDHSVIDAMTVVGVEDQVVHQVWRITVGGTILAVLSKDQPFTPQSTILTSNGFGKLYPGLNFNGSIAGIGLAGDSTVFKSTQSNLPSLDAQWDLGASGKRFNNIYGASGIFSNGIGLGGAIPSTNYRLQVNGGSYLNGQLTLGAGSTSAPPAKWSTGQLTTTPQVGAVEFDGNNFYFTGLLNGIPTRQQPIFAAATSASRTLYVSTLGNDSNDGRSKTAAFRSINRALKYIIDNNFSGYSIFVESGEYLEQNPMYVPPRISIIGDNLRRVIIRPVHNHLDLFHVDNNSYFFGMTFKDHRAPAFCFAFPSSLATARVKPDGTILEIIPTYSQSGYTTAPTVFIEGPGFGAGTQATARANLVNGAITDVIITNGGTNYATAPQVQITGGSGTGATASARISNGAVVAIDILTPGSGYTSPITVAISGGGGAGATATATVADGVIGSYTILNAGSGYDVDRAPWVSVKPVNPSTITSSPYVQNCSSITGPFDVNGNLISGINPPYDLSNPGLGYGAVDPNGAGGGLRIDGEVVSDATVIRSFVADAFTQLNQGGIGHLIINRGYTQFVSCFTTFSSVGYWARSGGFANISNSVIDFGDVGLKAEGYYPTPYTTGTIHDTYTSKVGSITVTNGGSGYVNGDFVLTITQGLGPGGTAATATAKVANGKVVAIELVTAGDGYTSVTPDPIQIIDGQGGIGAYILINLEQNSEIQIDQTSQKPTVGSAMLYNGVFHTVVSASAAGVGSWNVTISPPLVTTTLAAPVAFHDISNISTGGMAMEYVGSGVTYNALPRYGGIPNPDNQVVDKSNIPSLGPGVVYYITISNDGNFKIGPYFGVNFVDGTISLGPSASLNLTNITAIGPFSRNGATVGTSANEISDDSSLTHLSNPSYDQHTLTTQSAVRGYFGKVNSNVLPKSSGTFNLGSSTYAWNNIYGKLIAPSSTITTLSSTTANITTVNATNVNATTIKQNGNSVLDANNYTTYTVKKDGTGATGTWGIDISGNAATATTANSATNATTAATANALNTSNNYQVKSLGVGTPASGTTGEIRATGDIIGFYSSDTRLKENLEQIPSALDKVSKLTGYTFNWNGVAQAQGKDGSKREAGILAQDIEEVLPEVVQTRDNGYKAVDYEKIVPLLIEAIKDLRTEIEILKKR